MWWLLIFVLLLLFYIKYIKPLYYWRDKGITHQKPLPIVGNMIDTVLKKKSLLQIFQDLYTAFPEDRYIGIHHFTKPVLLLRDLELIKQITLKDFDYFTDHFPFITEDVDPLMGQNLFLLRGQRWRNMRAILSPSFTASKIRFMNSVLIEYAENLSNYIQEQGADVIAVEMKNIFGRCAIDAFVSLIYGVQVNSFKEMNNEFLVMGNDVLNFSGLAKSLRIFLINTSPLICRLFGIKFFPPHVSEFYSSVTKQIIQHREKEGLARSDVIHLLMETRKKHSNYAELNDKCGEGSSATAVKLKKRDVQTHRISELTDEDITAQLLSFFIGGFDTTVTAMSFTAYEIAVNPDVQKKLQAEIDETLVKCNGQLTWNALVGMKYLDMVVSEVLRKWPPAVQTDRMCVKEYTIQPEKTGERALTIYKDQVVMIPIIGIHRDPMYFPNPNKFDPERFSEQNKHNINPVAYMPFGAGPRTCIGIRFALMEIKTVICQLLKNFDIVPIKKTINPLEVGANAVTIMPANGIWLGLQQRKTVTI